MLITPCVSQEKSTANTIENNVTLAYEFKALLGEGAIWNYKTDELYWILPC